MTPQEHAGLGDSIADSAKARADRADEFAEWREGEIHRRAVHLLMDGRVLADVAADASMAEEIDVEVFGRQVYLADVWVHFLNASAIERDQIISRIRDAVFAALTAEGGQIARNVDAELEAGVPE